MYCLGRSVKHIASRVAIKNFADSLPSDIAEVRIHLAPTFTRSKPLRSLSLGLHDRLNQEKIRATISQMKEQVKKIIE